MSFSALSAKPRGVCVAPLMQALTASGVRGYICARYVKLLWIHGAREVRMSGSASEGRLRRACWAKSPDGPLAASGIPYRR
jgi:hypothetical protein